LFAIYSVHDDIFDVWLQTPEIYDCIVSKVQSILIECELNTWIGGNLASITSS